METLYEEHPLPPSLFPYVECCWTVTALRPAPDFRVLPDGCLDIVFSPEQGLQVVGAMTVRRVHSLAPGATFTGVRFRPGAAARFLRVAAQELTDRIVALEDLWGSRGRRLSARLGDACSASERASLLAGHLPPVGNAASDPALDAIIAANGDVDLDRIAGQANLSVRQFRRRCLAATGLSPKLLCRILRFRRALHQARNARLRTWADVAAECGYYDQAHLVRDFQEFAGAAPGFLAPCRA